MNRFTTILIALCLAACGSSSSDDAGQSAQSASESAKADSKHNSGTDELLPAGAACTTADECTSGICFGSGCGPGEGICGDDPNWCPTAYGPVCDCDGVTRQWGCDYRYAHLGPCVDGGTAP